MNYTHYQQINDAAKAIANANGQPTVPGFDFIAAARPYHPGQPNHTAAMAHHYLVLASAAFTAITGTEPVLTLNPQPAQSTDNGFTLFGQKPA